MALSGSPCASQEACQAPDRHRSTSQSAAELLAVRGPSQNSHLIINRLARARQAVATGRSTLLVALRGEVATLAVRGRGWGLTPALARRHGGRCAGLPHGLPLAWQMLASLGKR